MKYILAFVFLCLTACTSKEKYVPATDNLDAAREFLTAFYQGNFKKASFYMLQDEENKNWLLKEEEIYQSKSSDHKKQYAQSSLQNITIENVSTSEAIINYKNSFDKVGRKVKVVLKNNIWLVDYKYTFNGNL